MMRQRAMVVGALLALTGCGGAGLPEPTLEYQRHRSEIVGGTVDTGSPAVVALAVLSHGSLIPFCSGTLIAPRTVLTAAHCVNAYGANQTYLAVFGTYVTQPNKQWAPPNGYVRIVQQIRHPAYDSQVKNDIAVLRLESAVTAIEPVPYNTTVLTSAHVGMNIRHSGFGVTSAGTNTMGTKRHANYPIRYVQQTELESGAAGTQTCSGDSGGPGFIIVAGTSHEVVAGVVSYGDQDCNQFGFDAKVDYYAAWIAQTIVGWEAATCAADGQCKEGCFPKDVDCVCKADGVCNPECPDLLKDPDCPVDCVANGICAQDVCPLPDPDCVGEGQMCQYAEQCLWRQCVGDPQRSYTYCSMPCTQNSHCAVSKMECSGGSCRYEQRPTAVFGEPCNGETWCLGGGICSGPDLESLRCVLPCSGPGTCPSSDFSCEKGYTGALYCRSPEHVVIEQPRSKVVVLPQARIEGPKASSCAAAGGGQAGLGAAMAVGLLGLLRRRHPGIARPCSGAPTTPAAGAK